MRPTTLLVAFALLAAPAWGAADVPADPLAGYWRGQWEREGASLDVAFTFTPAASGYAAAFDSEQLRVVGIPLRDVTADPPAVTWKLVGDSTTTEFAGKLQGQRLVGTFREGEARGTFSLTRAASPPPRPREEEVVFHHGGVALAGTILLPAGAGPYPGVVFLHGSGAEGRWASRFLASRFVERGVAALIFDKRGAGASGGDWRTAGFEELAGDAAAAIATLRRHPGVAAPEVGIHGHSQGGTLAALVAEQVPDLAFVIASAASGVPMSECEEFSVGNAIGVSRLGGDEATAARAFVQALVAHAYGGASREVAMKAWQAVRERPWAFEPPPEEDPYWAFSRRIAAFDPPAHWRNVRAPVLLVAGENDERVPVRRSVAAITSALFAGRGSSVTVRLFAGADHSFRLAGVLGGGFAWPRTAAGYPQLLIDWVLAAPAPAAQTVASVDGARIHYLERRPPAPESSLALVFVPGWMMPADVWAAQLDHFGADHHVVAVDPRSQGESDKVADGNYPAMRARDLRAVIERLGLERVVLIGASSGVTDVVAYVDQFGTDRLAGLVLVHGVPGADFDVEATPGLLRWAQRFQTDRRGQTEALVRSLFATPPSEELVGELLRKALAMPTSSAIAAIFGSLTSDYRPALAKIDRPTVIITAKNAWAHHYEAMQRAIPGAQLEAWDGVGHALYIEQAARFNARLRELLRRLSP